MIDDSERMMFCEICGDEASCGFNVTLDGLKMGDVGNWRCSEHHMHRNARYTREEWAQARAEGKLYPDSTPAKQAAE